VVVDFSTDPAQIVTAFAERRDPQGCKPLSVTIDNLTFDHVDYDAGADVLYLHIGDPSTAVDFDSTPEGHALRFNAAGEIVGITLVGPRHLLDRDGKLEITLPHHVDVGAGTLDQALATASKVC